MHFVHSFMNVQVVIEWQPRGLAHLVHEASRTGMGMREPHDTSTCVILGDDDASNTRLGPSEKLPQVHTNPAFSEHLSKSVPIYPSASAGII